MRSPKETLTAALAATAMPAADDTFGADACDAQTDAGRCGVLVRVSPELRRELKLAAIARNTTVQDLMLEAIAIVLKAPVQAPKP
ncbi:ribbon-helix-helix domain-containing protein [Bradyrhizobium sp. Ash2021]|uniref:ribbon-helix-helix domain-containing protein n=1 Tax=Bradyrhizobium sp. Ash2021 TaxID=2954771 RepID=UPI0028155220|nr:ribbon-helix-helix domain-containing protein [Bradyrhizobium sp. Ash2021]WMT73462.1 hypothetical protein NL528_36815 [Bradyrhizobium sp. Ash2021]